MLMLICGVSNGAAASLFLFQVFFTRFACAYDAARRWNMTANSTLPGVC